MTSNDTSLRSTLSSLRSSLAKTLRIGHKDVLNITHEIHDISRHPVGRGGFSDIYTGNWRSTHGRVKVAIKVIHAALNASASEGIPRALRHEISIWARLSHPNIQALCGVYEDTKRFGPAPALVSRWNNNGDINKYIRSRAHPDVELLKLKLVAEVLSGLKFLHDERIVHGDIKGGNILISDDGTALLCDFGLSRLLLEHSQSTTSHGGKGTVPWMAPELLLVDGARPSYASDIWACGCLFIEVWGNVVPYHDKINQLQIIKAHDRGEPPPRPSDIPDEIWTIVQRCCDFDVKNRPSPVQVLTDIALRLVMHRVYPMVALGQPLSSAGSQTLEEIEMVLRVTGPPRLTELSILPDAELAQKVVRLLVEWTFSTGHQPSCSKAAFGWCYLRVEDLHSPLGRGVPTSDTATSTDRKPAELRPIARLMERASLGLGRDLMIDNATSALRDPLIFDEVVLSVAWFPDGKHLVAGCNDGSVHVLDVDGGAAPRLIGLPKDVNRLALSPNGRLLASVSDDKIIRLWDAETELAISAPMVGHTAVVLSLAFSPDGRNIVSGSSDKTIVVWSTETCRTVITMGGHTSSVCSVAYSPDGSRVVSGSSDMTVRVWVALTGDLILTLSGHTKSVQSVAYSPSGLHIISGSDDDTVRIWDARTGQPISSGDPLKWGTRSVRSVAYSPDGARIMSISDYDDIVVWDASTGDYIAKIRGHTGPVYSIALSPDGKRFASASRDCTVRIWDATDDWMRWDI